MTDKKTWGPIMWDILHKMAINYSDYPTYLNALIVYQKIKDYINHIPCGICQIHAAKYFSQNPPNMRNSETLQIWVWNFHNNVNLRLGKKMMSYQDYKIKYADIIKNKLLVY
jgi:FAD-linked sulfhydryl oxidase